MKYLIILSLLFAFIFDCKGQVLTGNEYNVLFPLKVVDSAGKRYIKIDPVDVYPTDEERSASMQDLLKMMQDSGIATMPMGTIRWVGGDTVAAKLDTIPVIMLVCDTTIEIRDTAYYNSLSKEWKDNYRLAVSMPWAYWQYGYSVREVDSGLRYSYHILKYLDADKKPIPKNIIVWMAKEIEK